MVRMAIDRSVFTGWALITRAGDVPGTWVAHCLEFDVASCGDSPRHALEMLYDAVGTCLVDDLNHGFDPYDRRAPEEEWEPLLTLFEEVRDVVRASEMDQTVFSRFAIPITLVLTRRNNHVEAAQGPFLNEAQAA